MTKNAIVNCNSCFQFLTFHGIDEMYLGMTTTFLTEGAFGRTAKSRGRRSSSTITVLASVCKQLIVNSDDFGGN